MKKFLTLILATMMIFQSFGVIAEEISGSAYPITKEIEIDLDLEIKRSTDDEYSESVKILRGKKVDLKALLDMQTVRDGVAAYVNKIDSFLEGYYSEYTGEDKADKIATERAYIMASPIDGQFIIKLFYPSEIVLPADITSGTDMYGFNEESNLIFLEDAERTVTTEGGTSILTVTIGVRDNLTIAELEENVDSYLADMEYTGGNIAINKTGRYELLSTIGGFINSQCVIGTLIDNPSTINATVNFNQIEEAKVDIIVTAQSGSIPTPEPEYTITYETDGGSELEDEQHDGDKVIDLNKIPTKEGYIFAGWYLDEERTQRVTSLELDKDVTLYAAWVKDNGIAGNGHETPEILNGEDHFAYVVGYPDGTVRPNDNIDRSEVTSIFFRLLKEDVRSANLTETNAFADVNDGDWYNTAISTMAKLGIVNGRKADEFVPNTFITRAEFAAICARFDDAEFEAIDEFTDVQGHWAENEIHEAAARGWIKGYEDGAFKPDQFITRAEAMTMINRVLNRVPEATDDLIDGMVKWSDNSDELAWYYLAVQEATNSHNYDMKNAIYEKWTAINDVTDWTTYEK